MNVLDLENTCDRLKNFYPERASYALVELLNIGNEKISINSVADSLGFKVSLERDVTSGYMILFLPEYSQIFVDKKAKSFEQNFFIASALGSQLLTREFYPSLEEDCESFANCLLYLITRASAEDRKWDLGDLADRC